MVRLPHRSQCWLVYHRDLNWFLYLSKDLSSVKLFVDDTSIFSTGQDVKHSTDQLNRGLDLISKCAYQWKMLFDQGPQKQTQKFIFSKKTIKAPHLSVVFNFPVVQSSHQKHLGVCLDQKLNLTHHIKEKVTKANKGYAVINNYKLNYIPLNAFLPYINPLLDPIWIMQKLYMINLIMTALRIN